MSHSVVINVRLYDSQDLHEKTYPEFYIINLWHVQEVKLWPELYSVHPVLHKSENGVYFD